MQGCGISPLKMDGFGNAASIVVYTWLVWIRDRLIEWGTKVDEKEEGQAISGVDQICFRLCECKDAAFLP